MQPRTPFISDARAKRKKYLASSSTICESKLICRKEAHNKFIFSTLIIRGEMYTNILYKKLAFSSLDDGKEDFYFFLQK